MVGFESFSNQDSEDSKDWFKPAPKVMMHRDTLLLDMGRKLLQEAKLGNVAEVKQLVSNGAPFTADWVGTSPLHWTAHYNHVAVTELLLRSGISQDARNKVERTPLHVASQLGHYEIVKLLLIFGADVNARDMLRMSPLHWAAHSGNRDIVRILLDHGSLINCVSKFGKTPSDVADDCGHYHVIKMIEEMKEMTSEERSTRINETRKQSALLGRRLRQSDKPIHLSSGDVFDMVSTRKKIGIIVNKNQENGFQKVNVVDSFTIKQEPASPPLSSTKTLEFLKDHGITMLEPDNGTVVSSAVESGQSVKLTEAGKLALNSSKPATSVAVAKSNKVQNIQVPKVNGSPLKNFNGKKIIKINAEQLINMTKEKKVIIKQATTIPNARFFEGKIYTDKSTYIAKVESRLEETLKQVDQLRKLLVQKGNEAAKLKKIYEAAIKEDNEQK